MSYIENVVIGKPIADPIQMFALDESDWNRIEQEKLIILKNVTFLKFLSSWEYIHLSMKSEGINLI